MSESTLYAIYRAVYNDDKFVARVTTACILRGLEEPDRRFMVRVAGLVSEKLRFDERGVLIADDVTDDEIKAAVGKVAQDEGGQHG